MSCNMSDECKHTLQELLAGILLEEGFVNNGASEVVNHELNNRLNLLFRITGIVGKSLVLSMKKLVKEVLQTEI